MDYITDYIVNDIPILDIPNNIYYDVLFNQTHNYIVNNLNLVPSILDDQFGKLKKRNHYLKNTFGELLFRYDTPITSTYNELIQTKGRIFVLFSNKRSEMILNAVTISACS